MKRFKTITITPAANGIIVHVQCQSFVYRDENLGAFLNDLSSYINDPEQTENRFAEKYGFSLGVLERGDQGSPASTRMGAAIRTPRPAPAPEEARR